MKVLLALIVVINIGLMVWQGFFEKSDADISYTYKVDRGNLVLLHERKN